MIPLFKFITIPNARRKFTFTMSVVILFVTITHYTALFGDLPVNRNQANSFDSFHFAKPNTAIVRDQTNRDLAIDKSIASFRSDNDPENNRSNDNAEARWVSMPNVTPYIGNDICPFESLDNIFMYGELKSSERSDKIQHCQNLKYTPSKGYEAPDPELIFEYLPPGATITFFGDSITRQAFLDFACQLFAISSVYKEVNENKTRKEKLRKMEVTFTSPDGKKNIVLKFFYSTELEKMIPHLQGANGGDVFIINQGAHFLGRNIETTETLINTLKELEPMLKEVMGRGVLVAWRETNAARFRTEDGYWNEDIGRNKIENVPITCVNTEELNASASFSRLNAKVNPVVESIGVPILDFWKPSVLLPTSCYKEDGDCLHLVPPGGTSFITENILNFIYSSLVNISVE